MRRVRTFVEFVVGVVVVGIVIHLIGDYLGDRYSSIEKPLIVIAITAVGIWTLFILTGLMLARFTAGRYAVEALILNSQNDLLVCRQPYHNCMLPPGGRVKRSEFPNEALQLRLQERLDLNPRDYRFDDRFHHGINGNSGNLGEVQRVAAPFLVQRELHKQRTFVDFHYDFFYVIKLLSDDILIKPAAKYQPAYFVDLDSLKEMVAQRRTFPDVLDAYQRVLNQIARGN